MNQAKSVVKGVGSMGLMPYNPQAVPVMTDPILIMTMPLRYDMIAVGIMPAAGGKDRDFHLMLIAARCLSQ